MPYLQPGADAPGPTGTALVVPVPAADTVVDEFRRDLDGAAAWGVPAHVTVLFPFVAPAAVDEALVRGLTAALGTVPAFDCRLVAPRWFGDDVLWLDPEPAAPFVRLTRAVWEAFPAHPPYGGAHGEVVPHLTIGERRLADLAALQHAERVLRPRLPVAARVDHVLLIAGAPAPASWRVLRRFDLGD